MKAREKYRVGLHPSYVPYYDALCQLLTESWRPYCGLRSIEEQRLLYLQGRNGKPGRIVTYRKPGLSAHNYGCATDWAPVDGRGNIYFPEFNDPEWKVYQDAVFKVGLIFASFEKPHNELQLRVRWKVVDNERILRGLPAAMDLITKEA